MPAQIKTFGGGTTTGLASDINTWLAANPGIAILSVQVVGRDMVTSIGLDLGVTILYDNGATMTTPFSVEILLAASMADMETDIATLITAAPTDFWAGPLIDNFTQRRRRDDWFALLFTSSDPLAQANWLAGGTTDPQPLTRADIVSADSPYSVPVGTEVVLADASGGAITAELPPAAEWPNQTKVIKKTDASGNAVTVEGNGAETIDGAANVALAAQYDAVKVFSTGTEVLIFAQVP